MNATNETDGTNGKGRFLDLVNEPFHAGVCELLKPDSVVVVYGPPASGKTLNRELFRTFFGREKLIDDGAVRGRRGYALPREGCVLLMQEERMRKLIRKPGGRLVVRIPVEAAIEMTGGVVPVAGYKAEQQGRVHELKTDPEVYDAVACGLKTFEIRFNDRDYQVGDVLRLRRTKFTGLEMQNGAELIYTGQEERRVVKWILPGPVYGLQAGWVIMAI